VGNITIRGRLKGIKETEVSLTLPVNALGQPIQSTQPVHAFLPVCDFGFKVCYPITKEHNGVFRVADMWPCITDVIGVAREAANKRTKKRFGRKGPHYFDHEATLH
jgi:hypothetical protein